MSYSAVSTTPNKDITRKARESLKGNWGISILALLVLGIVMIPIALIGIFLPGIQFLAAGALGTGMCCFFLRIIRSQQSELEDLFFGFKYFWLTVRAFFTQIILLASFMVITLMPALILAISTTIHNVADHGGHTPNWAILITSWLSAALFTPWVMAALSLSLTYFALNDHPQETALEALNHSNKLMKGHKWKLFCLFFRFFGWGLLCILTLGIGFLWLWPYMAAAHAAFYDDIKQLREPETRSNTE